MDQENNKIKLSQYLQACVDLKTNPNEESAKKINDLLAQLVIKPYIPLQEKMVIIGSIIFTITEEYDALGAMAHIETRKITEGLLHYVVNLDNDIIGLQNNYTVHDAIIEYGMYDIIIKYCKEDFDRLVRMIDDTFNFSNIYKLLESAQFFTDDGYHKWEEGMKNLKTELTPELMSNIQELLKFNSGEAVEQIRNDMGTQIVNDIDREMANNQRKIEKLDEVVEEKKKEN